MEVFIIQNWTTDEFSTNKDLEVTSAATKNPIGPTCKPIYLLFLHVDDISTLSADNVCITTTNAALANYNLTS